MAALELLAALASAAPQQDLHDHDPTILAVAAAEEAVALFDLNSGATLRVSVKTYEPTQSRRAIEVLVFEDAQNVLRIDLVYRSRLMFIGSS